MTGVRDVPDVSLFAADGFLSGSFYVYCEMDANASTGGNASSCDLNVPYQNFQGGGGTSFSAPAFAGIMAMVNQRTGQRQGNANSVLYQLAAQPGASCVSDQAAVSNFSCIFYDVQTGNNSVACDAGSLNCSNTGTSGYGILAAPGTTSPTPDWNTTAGYDLATGLGTVNAYNLVQNWNTVEPYYKLVTTPSSLIITAPGDSGSTTISLSAVNGFNGTVSLSCTVSSFMTGGSCSLASSLNNPGRYYHAHGEHDRPFDGHRSI